jgi:hypothetical protein
MYMQVYTRINSEYTETSRQPHLKKGSSNTNDNLLFALVGPSLQFSTVKCKDTLVAF